MSNLGAVIRFTFLNRAKAKSTIITTLVFMLLITVGINLPYIISMFSSDESSAAKTIAVVDDSTIASHLQSYFDELGSGEWTIETVASTGSSETDLEQLRQGVENGDWHGYLELQTNEAASFPSIIYHSQESVGMAEQNVLISALQTVKTQFIAEQLNLNQEQLAELSTPVSFDTSRIAGEGGLPEEEGPVASGTAYILVYVMIVLLFFGVVMYGNLISTEVTSEKSSRVMEILISSISPVTQMFGKVIGMLILAMVQILIYFVTAVVNLLLPHNIEVLSQLDINFGDIPIGLIIAFFFFYFAGFLLYSLIFAALGSVVSRTEDLGQAVTPVTFLLLAAFYIGIFGMNTPDSTFMMVSSYIPFFTPFLMFLRMGLGSVAAWEVLLGVLSLVAAIVFFTWLAAKIYRVGVLMYGKKPSIKDIIKAMKAYNV